MSFIRSKANFLNSGWSWGVTVSGEGPKIQFKEDLIILKYIFTFLCLQRVWVSVALLVHCACGRASVGGVRGGASGRGRGLTQKLGRALHLQVSGVLVSLSEQEETVPHLTSHDVMFAISWQQQEVWSHEQLTHANIGVLRPRLWLLPVLGLKFKSRFSSFFCSKRDKKQKTSWRWVTQVPSASP